MSLRLTNSFVPKMLPLTPFSGKIWREFLPTVMIPKDRGGGGYIDLTSRTEHEKRGGDSCRKPHSPHFQRHQIPAVGSESFVIHCDLAVCPCAGERVGANQGQRFVIRSLQLQGFHSRREGQNRDRRLGAIDRNQFPLQVVNGPLVNHRLRRCL